MIRWDHADDPIGSPRSCHGITAMIRADHRVIAADHADDPMGSRPFLQRITAMIRADHPDDPMGSRG